MAFLENLKKELKDNGWKVKDAKDFELLAEKRYMLFNRCYMFLKFCNYIDKNVIKSSEKQLEKLKEGKFSFIRSNIVVLCLVSKNVNKKIGDIATKSESMVLIGPRSVLCIVDTAKKGVFIHVPALPLDINSACSDIRDIIIESL